MALGNFLLQSFAGGGFAGYGAILNRVDFSACYYEFVTAEEMQSTLNAMINDAVI